MRGYHVRRDGACDRAAKRQTTRAVCLFAGETAAKSGEIRTHDQSQNEEKSLEIARLQVQDRTTENRGVPSSNLGLAISSTSCNNGLLIFRRPGIEPTDLVRTV